jgi:hypothetical protein
MLTGSWKIHWSQKGQIFGRAFAKIGRLGGKGDFLKLALYIYSSENAKNEHLRKIYFVTLMRGIA